MWLCRVNICVLSRTAMKQCLVMGVAVEPLPEFAGPSNEGVAFIHDYALNV